jgi:DNA-binding MarR family transcriptional regulator
MPEAGHEDVLAWVERLARYCADQDGLPMIAGRVLGWLMICDPPEQSPARIAEAIRASRASLTTNLRLLTSVGFLSRVSRPGDRTTYYRVHDDAWAAVVRRQIASVAALGEITRDGLVVIGSDGRRAARLRGAQAVVDWMVRVFDEAPTLPSRPGGRP